VLTSYRRFGIIGGFGILLMLLIGNAIIIRRDISVLAGAQSRVSHARQVLFALRQTESLLINAEAGQRGYLYTGTNKYLGPYNDAIGQIEPQINTLANLTADNPRQQAMIPVLRNLVHEKVAEMADTITVYESGKPDAAKQLVLSDTGLLLMDHIRLVMAQMENEETSLDAARSVEYRRSILQTISSIYGASLLATLGLVILAYYILREIDLRDKHAKELRWREEWFRVTLTSIGDAVVATDSEGAVTFLNPVAENLTGTSLAQAKGRNILAVFPIFNELTHEPAENPVQKVLREGRVVGLANHTVLMREDGTQIPIEDSAAPIRGDKGELLGVVLVFRDVTSERKSEEVMRKTERLATAARLSATVAHEINNPLEAVVSLVYLAKTMPGVPPSVIWQLTLAEQELERVAHITQQALGFYRDSRAAGLVEMPALIDSVFALYSNRLKSKDIRVERNYGECPPLQTASGELKQVIANLVANAADAVGNQGTIAVTLGCIEEAGRAMLQMVVEDDGPGIPPEHRQHLFEPFFTTKKDVGTGLGLWLTKEIVERHGGTIQVIPPSRGTIGVAFSILLPIAAISKAEAGNGEAPLQN